MRNTLYIAVVFVYYFCFIYAQEPEKIPAPKYDNPDYIKDRHKYNFRPTMDDEFINRFKQKYHPSWQDYCDVVHCNDYHKLACGFNRRAKKFSWFKSKCHLVYNNMCAYYRGLMKFRRVPIKHCLKYGGRVDPMWRTGCPNMDECRDQILEPLCGMNSTDGRIKVFYNSCYFQLENCNGKKEYEEVDLILCHDANELRRINLMNLLFKIAAESSTAFNVNVPLKRPEIVTPRANKIEHNFSVIVLEGNNEILKNIKI